MHVVLMLPNEQLRYIWQWNLRQLITSSICLRCVSSNNFFWSFYNNFTFPCRRPPLSSLKVTANQNSPRLLLIQASTQPAQSVPPYCQSVPLPSLCGCQWLWDLWVYWQASLCAGSLCPSFSAKKARRVQKLLKIKQLGFKVMTSFMDMKIVF